ACHRAGNEAGGALPPLFLVSSGRRGSKIARSLASPLPRDSLRGPSPGCREPRMIMLKRAYEPASKDGGLRVLVERLWPRGVSKQKAKIDLWLKDLAPSTELRKWYGHDPARRPQCRKH